MRRFIIVSIILFSFSFSYEVGDQVSISDQQLTKEVCYAPLGGDMVTGDDLRMNPRLHRLTPFHLYSERSRNGSRNYSSRYQLAATVSMNQYHKNGFQEL